jgi:hypothetical protein
VDLLGRQDELQAEAAAVRDELGLDDLLPAAGTVVPVGSAALGLMVWRDLDLTVVCLTLDAPIIAWIGSELAKHDQVREVVFRNDTGEWNTNPAYPDGYFLGVKCKSSRGERWELDFWFIDEPDRQPDLAHVRSLPPRLTAETREAILLVKDAWAGRPEYGKSVSSFDIYTAVLDGDVRTPAQFDTWRSARAKA